MADFHVEISGDTTNQEAFNDVIAAAYRCAAEIARVASVSDARMHGTDHNNIPVNEQLGTAASVEASAESSVEAEPVPEAEAEPTPVEPSHQGGTHGH